MSYSLLIIFTCIHQKVIGRFNIISSNEIISRNLAYLILKILVSRYAKAFSFWNTPQHHQYVYAFGTDSSQELHIFHENLISQKTVQSTFLITEPRCHSYIYQENKMRNVFKIFRNLLKMSL